MKRTRVFAIGAAGALLVVAATSFASPWLTLQRMQSAIARRDADAVSAQVDFPALRESVKSQVLASIKAAAGTDATNPLAAAGAAAAMAMINPVVDAIASPRGVGIMLEQGRIKSARQVPPAAGGKAPERPRLAGRYRGWSQFVLATEHDGNFVFRRAGLWSWKLAGIEVPVTP